MQVEQAIFTSASLSGTRGYHLVARSSGIREELAHTLSQWSPSQNGLLASAPEACSVSYFPAQGDWSVVMRTMYGGPEYSGRGGFQVLSAILAVRHEQLAAYHHDVLALARTAQALGYLRLPSQWSPRLPAADLPATPLVGAALAGTPPAGSGRLDQAVRLLRQNQRIALLASPDPLADVAYLLRQLDVEQRRQVSFTTGLRPSLQRPFDLHLIPTADDAMRGQLVTLGITCVGLA